LKVLNIIQYSDSNIKELRVLWQALTS
jgi:hypothetical protein